MSIAKAHAALTKDLDALTWDGCPEDCWPKLQEIVRDARTLRTAMHADDRGGAGFWTDAYALINQMEDGAAKVDGDAKWNRPLILTPAHDLDDWAKAHPVE